MKLIARNIVKHAMKQDYPESSWYFFNLSGELLTNCSFEKKIKGNSLFLTFQHCPAVNHGGEIPAFPWKAFFTTPSKEYAIVPLKNTNAEIKGLFGKMHCFLTAAIRSVL